MDAFPDDFSLDYATSQFSQSTEMKCARQYVYESYLRRLRSGYRWCYCDLSSYNKNVRKLVVGEILTKFDQIYQVDPKEDCKKKRIYYVNAYLIDTDVTIREHTLNHIMIPLVKYSGVMSWSGKKQRH